MTKRTARGVLFAAAAAIGLAGCGPGTDRNAAGSSAAASDSAATTSSGTGTMGTGTGNTGAATSGTGTTGSSAGGTGTTSPTGAAGTMGDTTHVRRDSTPR